MENKSINFFTLILIAVLICGTFANIVKAKSRPPAKQSVKTNAAPQALPKAGNLSAQAAALKCSSLNGKQLDTCCATPIADYFTINQKTTCNGGKTDLATFKYTFEYLLNKHQNIINKLDLATGALKIGKFACFAECIFEKSELMPDGEIDGDAVAALFAENLDETWAEIVTTVTGECVTSVAAATTTTKTVEISVKSKVTKVCKLAPVLILQCVIRKAGLACPADAQSKTTPCVTARTGLTTCDPFPAAE